MLHQRILNIHCALKYHPEPFVTLLGLELDTDIGNEVTALTLGKALCAISACGELIKSEWILLA
jgi:hypothetical protein